MPCNRCANLGKAAECRESVPLSTLNSSASSSPSTQASSSSTSSSSSSTSSSSSSPSSSSSAYQPLHKRQKVAPAFISPAPGPGGTPAPFLLASHAPLAAAAAAAVNSNGVPFVPAAHLAGFPPGAFLRPLPLASFFAASPGGGALPAPPTPGQAAAAAWMAAEDRQSGREKEKQETQEMERERERAQRAQQREKEQRERDTEQKEHRLLEKQLERERHMNELVVNLLNEIKLLKTTTRQLRGESEHLRKQIASLQVERKNSPPSEQMEPSFDRPLLISSNSAASWIPYSNPSQPHTMPPGQSLISSVFPPMSEANIAFVVDDDNKPFCLIKRQPLADDRVAIIHSMNAAWTKVLLYTSEELTGQSIRKVVEDASLRESRNRINSFHAQQFFYDAVTREPLWSLLCIDGVRDSEREQHQKFSPCSSPDPLMQRGSPQARPAGPYPHKPSPPSSVSNGFGRAGSSRGSADNDDRDEEAAKDNTARSSSSSSPSPSSTTTGGGDAAERHMYSRDRAEPDSQQGGDADWMTATRMRADDAQRRGGGGGGGGGQHVITNQASDKGNSDGDGRMMGWGSSMITDPRQGEGREAGGTSQSQQQQQQQQQRRVPPPLSPATLDLLNSLNNIQSWP
ncbi:uncharacterized protein ACA1_096280 [Acanthamoeba castellanii str. Neff]|uniref:BZIP domain-containing protein n=1 Tax=Acanthamoeba castellanii (strain ATCC 30010 / Neff) TaxID=1257118 RepID=L8GIX1_ACACF|nr:uncharacterized protein ACA1_096280 [Acanthamoeba castellanii str. Neff]ELR12957.1 hypothetical protein ACA1_096280 [Acanthamoeba castellanii str. Neff]